MSVRVIIGDCREELARMEAGSVQCCVTSPPYFQMRNYGGQDRQLGLEHTPQEFVDALVGVMREVRRVLRKDGTLWLNLGDTYVGGRSGGTSKTSGTSDRNHAAVRGALEATGGTKHRRFAGYKPKDMIGLPWRVALALQADGWWLRSDIIWHKPNAMPESVVDRPSRSHEYLFLLTKSARYYYDADAIRTPISAKTLTSYGTRRKSKGTDTLGRVYSHNLSQDVPERKPRLTATGAYAGANKRTVWSISTTKYEDTHSATFPRELVEPCIRAGTRPGDVVLDPFAGTGTTLEVALRLGRSAIGIEINPADAEKIDRRLSGTQLPLREAP